MLVDFISACQEAGLPLEDGQFGHFWHDELRGDDQLWAERAYQMLQDGSLHAEIMQAHSVLSFHVSGSCPRCGDPIDDWQPGSALTGLLTTRGSGTYQSQHVDVTCGCGQMHDGAPEMITGCGVSFRIEFAEHAGQQPQTAGPDGGEERVRP